MKKEQTKEIIFYDEQAWAALVFEAVLQCNIEREEELIVLAFHPFQKFPNLFQPLMNLLLRFPVNLLYRINQKRAINPNSLAKRNVLINQATTFIPIHLIPFFLLKVNLFLIQHSDSLLRLSLRLLLE
jgi:hypothetical protein